MSAKNFDAIDRKIISISKSTRTSLTWMIPLHNTLRNKFSWYHSWHLKPFANTLHWFFLSAFILGSVTGISIYYSVQGRQVSAYSGDAPNTSSVRQEVFALPDSNSKVSDGATGESSGTSKNSAISAEQNTGVPTSPNVVPPSLPSAPDTANPPATEPPPQEPEETGSIIEWDVIVADLEIFTRTANEAIGKVSKFESDPDKGGIDQQNVDSLFVFLVKNKKSLTTTISRDKKTLGILGDYSSEKKVLLFDTGKQTQFIDLLKDESLKGIEVGVKKKTIDKPIKEIL